MSQFCSCKTHRCSTLIAYSDQSLFTGEYMNCPIVTAYRSKLLASWDACMHQTHLCWLHIKTQPFLPGMLWETVPQKLSLYCLPAIHQRVCQNCLIPTWAFSHILRAVWVAPLWTSQCPCNNRGRTPSATTTLVMTHVNDLQLNNRQCKALTWLTTQWHNQDDGNRW